jgi:hypothetical protein
VIAARMIVAVIPDKNCGPPLCDGTSRQNGEFKAPKANGGVAANVNDFADQKERQKSITVAANAQWTQRASCRSVPVWLPLRSAPICIPSHGAISRVRVIAERRIEAPSDFSVLTLRTHTGVRNSRLISLACGPARSSAERMSSASIDGKIEITAYPGSFPGLWRRSENASRLTDNSARLQTEVLLPTCLDILQFDGQFCTPSG